MVYHQIQVKTSYQTESVLGSLISASVQQWHLLNNNQIYHLMWFPPEDAGGERLEIWFLHTSINAG